MDVYADQQPGTAEILHYKVPVLGPKCHIDIFINLSLRPRYITSENQLSINLNLYTNQLNTSHYQQLLKQSVHHKTV